jgi:hypothetical protein
VRIPQISFPLALVITALIFAGVGTLASSAVAPASGSYYQAYNCESFVGRSTCNQTAGSWWTLTNVGATNWSVGGDICDAWGNIAWTMECYISGTPQTILECYSSGMYGYGWAGTYWGDDWNISGHEDNYTTCS